jgi:hypothetical protein
MKRLIASILTILAMAAGASAAVTYDAETRSLTVSGVSTNFLMSQVRTALSQNDVDTVFMSGPGGLKSVGHGIGRMIREYGVRVIIPSDTMCASACASAAIAATDLVIDGELLFHRARFSGVPSNRTIDEIGALYGIMFLESAEYFIEMGFGIEFIMRLVEETNQCVFLVADAERGLDDMYISDRCEA